MNYHLVYYYILNFFNFFNFHTKLFLIIYFYIKRILKITNPLGKI